MKLIIFTLALSMVHAFYDPAFNDRRQGRMNWLLLRNRARPVSADTHAPHFFGDETASPDAEFTSENSHNKYAESP